MRLDQRESYRQCFRCLFAVAKAICEDVPIEILLRRISREASSVIGAETTSIMLLDESGERLLFAAADGLSQEEQATISFRRGEGVAGWVVENVETAQIEDVSLDDRFTSIPGQQTSIRSMLAVPLTTRGGCIGVLSSTHSQRSFDEDDEELLSLIAHAIVLDLEVVRLRHLADRDPLTGARSRHGLEATLEAEIDSARIRNQPLSVILLDLDNFKTVNDGLGHQFGDDVLSEAVRRSQSLLKESDHLFRYGGDEFLIILPGCDLTRGREVAERIRSAFVSDKFSFEGKAATVSVTPGVAELRPEDGTTGAEVIQRADQELLEGKRARPSSR